PTDADLGLKSVIAGPRLTVMDCELRFPATSTASTVMVFDPGPRLTEQLNAPLCTSAAVPLQVALAIPESVSLTLPFTASVEVLETELLAGEAMLTTGGVLSSFTVVVAEALLPATSVDVPVTAWFALSVVTSCATGHTATPDNASEHWKDTVTSVLFHPAALG